MDKRKAGSHIVTRPALSKPFHVLIMPRTSNRPHAVYAIPQTHFKRMLEMSLDRYIHIRDVYCCIVMWHVFQIVESSERAKDKASIYAFL